MDIPNYQSAYELHEKRWTCECADQTFVYKIFSNNTKHFGTQCERCGKWRSVKREDVPLMKRADLPLFDPSVSLRFQDDKYRDYQSSVDTIKQEEWEAEQQRRQAYYNTPKWKRLTLLRLRLNEKLFNGLCETCFKEKACRCHHITYERLCREWIFDLAAICEECHIETHADNPLWSGHGRME